ncbi:MAG: 6-phosphogluconolactonase [Nitrosomonadales bacterium]|nr:6-phosphogluconolactonase [Nitrosomonadales bacterium]
MKSTVNAWLSCKSQKEFELKIVERIVTYAAKAIKDKGSFSLVLAGGNTPARIYEALTKINCDWKNWHIYFGDERCLPVNHKERNSVMADESFFSKIPIPKNQIYIIPAELGEQEGAEVYNKKLNPEMVFDLVLLGLGEDGHMASIFPNSKFDYKKQVTPITNAPKLPQNRVSLTPERLSKSNYVIFIVSGKSKKIALEKFKNSENIPATKVSALRDLSVVSFDTD